MMIATASGAGGKQLMVLGLTRENIRRLFAGDPILVDAEHHSNCPADLAIAIVFGDTEQRLVQQLQFLFDEFLNDGVKTDRPS